MSKTVEILGEQAGYYLSHVCRTIDKKSLYLPGPDTVDRIWAESDRSIRTLGSLQWILSNGRLGGTGYVSILPVDQGIEHSAGASFAPNPAYFDPENIVRLAVGATIYFGSPESRRQLVEIARAFDLAHELGMATILWCYLRNEGFRKEGADYHASADLTGQADHLGVTIKADIVKQKLPSNNGGFRAVGFGKTSDKVYTELTSDHPIDLCRYQVANGYMGRVGLINSGGESRGASDLQEAVTTAVINKRAGGMGLISGRKAFQRPMKDGIALLHAIQDVYLDDEVTIA